MIQYHKLKLFAWNSIKGGFQHTFCQCDTHLFFEGEFWKRGILSPMLPERGRKIDDLILHSRLICNCVRRKQQDKLFPRFLTQILILITLNKTLMNNSQGFHHGFPNL